MPRVVTDQKTKFETDEIFKKLSQDVDVSLLKLWLASYSSCSSYPEQISNMTGSLLGFHLIVGEVHWIQRQTSGGAKEEVC